MDGSDPLRLLAHALQMAEKATGDADLRAKHQDRKIEVLRGEVARLASKCDKLENDLEESRKSLAEERRTSALRADAARAAEEYLRAHRQRAAEELARAAKTLHVLADRQNRLSLDFGRSSELVMTRKLPKIGSDTDGEGSDGLNRSGHPCSQPTVSLETSSQSPERLRERTESPERPRERTESTSPSSPNEDGDGVQTTNQRSEMSHQSPTGAADETSSETVPDPAPASGDARADLNEPETPTPPQVEPQSQSLGRVVALSSERAESATNSCERTAPPGDSTNSVTDFRGGPCVRQTRKRVSLVDADAGKLRARKRAKLGDGTTSTSASPPSPAAPMTVLELGHMVVLPGMRLEAGTLVWAKAARFPWWPAVVYADSTPWIPREVLKNALEQRGKVEDFLYIVCFFAEPPSWACVPLDQIRALADSKELDEDMLSFHSRHQRWKSNKNQIRLCRRAYEEAIACAEIEGGDEDATPEAGCAHIDDSVGVVS